jgi:hypothetical protein
VRTNLARPSNKDGYQYLDDKIWEHTESTLHYRREFEKTCGGLQKCGTRSAHRTLLEVSSQEDEYMKHVMHFVANGIVEEALEHECDGIISEERV